MSDTFVGRELLAVLFGALIGLFAFLFIWPFYPPVGAGLTLVGVLLALVGVCWPDGLWIEYALRWRLLATVAVLVALDDAVSHSFGVWTPVDWAWRVYVWPVVV